MKLLFWILFLVASLNVSATDLALGSVLNSPVSDCDLTDSEIVKLTIINADVVAYSGSFSISYAINGANTTTENVTIPILPVGGTYIYTFNTLADLSDCGVHSLVIYVDDPNDNNASNDSLSVQITNDCTPDSGTINAPSSVCELGNTGQLELVGNTGVITDWVHSSDNGSSWISSANTTAIEQFTDITSDRIYKIYYDSQYGLCPSDSISDTIFVDLASNAGTLSSDSAHCDTIFPTTLYLNGYNGDVVNYQLSVNGGNTYSNFVNPYDTLEYNEFGNSFQFFAITKNGTCPSDSSNLVFISIIDGPDAGEIVGEDTLCIGQENSNLDLVNYNGTIVDWQYSLDDGANWTSSGFNGASYTLPSINNSVKIRTIVEKVPCGTDTSFFDITVLPASDAGTLLGAAHYCDTLNSGNLNISPINGNILEWLKTEDNGNTLSAINGTNDTLYYADIKTTTGYAVIVQYLNCPADTSNFVNVSISSGSEAGEILIPDTLCPSTSGVQAELSNYFGNILDWQYSVDGDSTWISSGITDSLYSQTDIYGHASFRAIVMDGNCDADTTMKSFFVFGPFDVVEFIDTIAIGDSIALNTSNGVSFQWTPNIYIDDATSQNPKVSPPINTIYEASVIDSNGCALNTTHTIIVVENLTPITINNFISPNGDGINDTWQIENIELFPDNSVYVFDSYGQLIFKESPYYNDWDVNNANLPNGTYFYTVFTKPNDPPHKGTVTIIDGK